MTNRLLDFADNPAHLSTENGLLVIHKPDQCRQTVPLTDIAAVVTSHRQVTLTQNLLAALGAAGVILICCDERHVPASMLLPLDAHFGQAGRFQTQATASLPLKKRIWRELVRAKIRAQARTLRRLGLPDPGLEPLSRRVRSGDPGNVEATAALRYWPRVFGQQFRRSNDADPRNALLNYGYAILRGVTARAVCAAGLHPSLGLNHRNKYNPFCLADDLMEPLRPLIDYSVVQFCCDSPREHWQLNRTAKLMLMGAVAGRYGFAGERRTLFDIVGIWAQRLTAVLEGRSRKLGCEPIETES
ncbi:MAG: type II CRISPR-associated endonuclease Cas1 [Bryobacteraceae bacterium]